MPAASGLAPKRRLTKLPKTHIVIGTKSGDRSRLQAVIQNGKTSGGLAQTVLGPLLDPALVAAGESALLLLGTDDENGGEVVQEWWVRIET